MAKFQSKQSTPQFGSTEHAEWLKVKDVDDSDNFIIMDEIAHGRSKYEKEDDASGMIKRISDGKLFMKTFKPVELEKLAQAFGEDSAQWVKKEIEIKMLVSKKWNKPFLATNPVVDLDGSPF